MAHAGYVKEGLGYLKGRDLINFKGRDCVISWRGVRSFQGEGLGSVSWICQGGIRLFEGEGFD